MNAGELLAPGSVLRREATGFGFLEGPNWCDAAACLVFSDIPRNTMWQWVPGDGLFVYRHPSNMGNGGAYDSAGRLVTCEHATSRLVREEANGQCTVLAASHMERQLNSPNDVIVASDGTIYFTDPTYGRMEYFGIPRSQELAFQGVFRLPPSGELELLADDFDQPNGLCLSLDERVLYVNDTARMHIRQFPIASDGSISGGEVWAEVAGDGEGAPDGMKVNSIGDVYCTGPGGIHVFNKAGEPKGRIRVPENTANFNWGMADRSLLFITASTSLYSVLTREPGVVGR